MQLTIKGIEVSQNVLRELHAKAKAIKNKKTFFSLLNEYVLEQKNAKRNEKNSINPIF
jgi:hypothetical protein